MKKILSTIICLIALFTSCSKIKSPVLLCKTEISSIKTTTQDNGVVRGNTTATYQYDSIGRCTDNTYTSSSIIAEGGIFTYLLNSSGIPVRQNVIDGSYFTFSYQSNGYLSQRLFYPMGSSLPGEIYTYQWQNGNLITMVDSNLYSQTSSLYSYSYTTQPYQQLDPDYVPLGNQSANLLKTQTATYNGAIQNGQTFSYSYQFDNEGRVSTYTTTVDTILYTYNLSYKCN